MKAIDRLILKAQRLNDTGGRYLSMATIERSERGTWSATATLWNGRRGYEMTVEDISREFDSREEADAFIDDLATRYPGKDNPPVIIDAAGMKE